MSLTFPPLPLPGNILRVDNSMLEDWQTCPRLFAFKHLWKRVRAGTVAARDAGKAWHAAMENWYSSVPVRPVGDYQGVPWRLQAAQDALREGYEDLEMPDSDHRTLGRMLNVLEKYAERWGEKEQFIPLAVEVPMEWELGRLRRCDRNGNLLPECDPNAWVLVIYQGRMDLLVQWADATCGGAGQILVCDTKTMQQWGETEKQTEYQRSAQLKGYMWLVQKICEAGKWKRGAGTFAPRGLETFAEMAEDRQALLAREPWRSCILRDDIQPAVVHGYLFNAVIVRAESTRRKTPIPREEFKRLRFWPTQEELERWRQNTLDLCADILAADAFGRWPEHASSCANQWGRPCSHLSVCNGPEKDILLDLSMDRYQDNTWDPMRKEKD